MKPKDATDYNHYSFRNKIDELALLKTNPLELLYTAKYDLYIVFEEKDYVFNVECAEESWKGMEDGTVIDFFIPDCKISSHSANMYFRTEKGKDANKYKTFPLMIAGIIKRSKQINLTLLAYKFVEVEKGSRYKNLYKEEFN